MSTGEIRPVPNVSDDDEEEPLDLTNIDVEEDEDFKVKAPSRCMDVFLNTIEDVDGYITGLDEVDEEYQIEITQSICNPSLKHLRFLSYALPSFDPGTNYWVMEGQSTKSICNPSFYPATFMITTLYIASIAMDLIKLPLP
ncbi:hypothetical protein L2E82_21403 [Cichorium intybus]|uniref:Uncharacterized protein n=1 Tax=Cichorium intybus TaxID=13427 RepID=A0ACB9DWQ0_CICIN|nr:hypothetical protein L2E82_21403 [Cichorium intybus]